MEHPFARYPYQPHPNIDPRYVGNPLYAPMAQRPPRQPPRKSGCGWWLAIFGVGSAALCTASGCCVFMLALTAPPPNDDEQTWDEDTEQTDPTLVDPDDGNGPTGTGDCRADSSERMYAEVVDFPSWGSAVRLRGRVEVIGLVLGRPNRWTPRNRAHVLTALEETCAFYRREARRYGVDLVCEPARWSAEHVRVLLPPINANGDLTVSEESAVALREMAHESVRLALGTTLDEIVVRERARGFDSIAFLCFLPIRTNARDFAEPLREWEGDPRDQAELAMVFEIGVRTGELGYVSAHEALHLFGAADLYRIIDVGAGDEGDVMNESCDGLRGDARIRALTAYSVGLSDRRPNRRYAAPQH